MVLAASAGALAPLAYTWFVADHADPLMAARGLAAGAVVAAAVGPFLPPWAAALLGLTPGTIGFDINNAIIFKGATVRGIAGRRLWDTWYRMRGLLEAGLVDLWPLVTHRYTLDQWEEAIQAMNSGATGKVVMFVGEG